MPPCGRHQISTHSRAKAAGLGHRKIDVDGWEFQLTAARRRLACENASGLKRFGNFNSQPREGGWQKDHETDIFQKNFNSQPREGGWKINKSAHLILRIFQLTAARRRLGPSCVSTGTTKPFQLTAARRRLAGCDTLICFYLAFQLTAARRRLGTPTDAMPDR